MSPRPSEGDRWRSPSGAEWIVQDVDETAATLALETLPDGGDAQLENLQRYTLGEMRAARGFELVGRENECPGCGTTAVHEPTSVKHDGSGFSRCPGCEKTQIWTAGSWPVEA